MNLAYRSLVTSLVLTCAGVTAAAPAAATGGKLQPLDVFQLEYANDPRISPDGSRIVYERRALDVMTDKVRRSLWIIDTDGTDHRPLLADRGSYGTPRWSPDGTRIAYVSAGEGSPQVYVRWLDSGQTALVTNLEHAPTDLVWSPDGGHLAFTMKLPATPKPMVTAPARPEGAEWAPPVKVIESVIYRFDGRGFVEPAHEHIFIVPADGGSPRQLTRGDFNHEGPLSFMPDGSGIVFVANRDPDWEYDRVARDLWRVGVHDREIVRLTDHGEARAPVVAPDGRHIAFLRAANRKVPYRPARLWVMGADGTGARPLTADLDRVVRAAAWSGNDRLHMLYDDRGRRVAASVRLDAGRTHLTDSVGSAIGRPYVGGSMTVNQDGVMAFTQADPQRPADVAVQRVRGEPMRLTDLNADLLQHRALGAVRELDWTSSVGDVPIHGWAVLPPDYEPGTRYPMILELHGGPHAAYGPFFSAEMQLMAARGYVVLYDNYRGSASYGEAFGQLLRYKYSSADDFADHMAGIDALIAAGIVDPDRLFVTGGSAGGIATLYAIGLTDRFRAAAAAKPIANWLSKTLTGDIYTYQIDYQFPGPPWEHVEHYWRRSPLSLVGNVTTPTMIITGEEDYRTPISETEQYYQALKLRRVDAAMVRVPESSHGIAQRPSNLIAKVQHILAWFARYDVPTGGPTGGSTDEPAGEAAGAAR